jgi:hypothetical protein
MPRRLENINNLEVVQTHKTSVPKLSGNGSVITYRINWFISPPFTISPRGL